ncbi:hypothetical protein CMO89_04195 [Candidatus Woesearchaeota archaeon]|nr:hypothetical protein [Candidatus Woesearchaeota archaeon]|tara:strand:- start:4904 stop:5326 length:423 start_codon:yes stop_codon:yes gene_type:complete
MRLLVHFIVSLALVMLLYPFYKEQALLIFIGGFLIDIDHYLWYMFRFKDFNLKKALEYYKKLDFKDVLILFHTIEFVVVVFLLSLYPGLGLLFVGYIIHIIMDTIYMYKCNILGLRAFSLILWIKRRIDKRARGKIKPLA